MNVGTSPMTSSKYEKIENDVNKAKADLFSLKSDSMLFPFPI